MKALVLSAKGLAPQLMEVPLPIANEADAIVEIRAASLNHRDLWIQKGQYAGLKYPLIPGSDGAGIVRSVGNSDHAHWKGKEVIINPSLNWGDKTSNQDQAGFSILGLPDNGTFAEFVKIPISNLVAKPPHLSFLEAAALPLAGLTAFRGLFTRALARAGERILITGIGGGVALFALQFSIALKGRTFVTSGSDEKIDRAKKLGAEGAANYKEDKWVEKLQKMAGSFDIIIDGSAGPGTGDLLNLASPGGRIVIYGATAGNSGHLEMRRIFWKQLNLLGSTMGSPRDFSAMVDYVNLHSIKPTIDQVFQLSEGASALQKMDDGKQFGKILLNVNGH
jgi:zinc-binding alcohol dehydrogenase/oxidoreductase